MAGASLLAQNATHAGRHHGAGAGLTRTLSAPAPLFGPLAQDEDEDAVNRAMQATGVTDLARQSVDTLSGGQRQRAWIAMVLAQETSIMLG